MMTIYYFLVNHNDLDHALDFDHDLNHDLYPKVEVAVGMTSMVVDTDIHKKEKETMAGFNTIST